MAFEWTIPNTGLAIIFVAIAVYIMGMLAGIKNEKLIQGVTIVGALGVIVMAMGVFAPMAFQPGYTPSQQTQVVYQPPAQIVSMVKEAKLINQVDVIIKDKYDGSFNTVDGTLDVYQNGVTPDTSNAKTICSATLTNGVIAGTECDLKLMSETPYNIYFKGGSDPGYYDTKFVQSVLSLTSTTAASGTDNIMVNLGEAIQVATIDDPLDETSISGIINGQTTNNSLILATNEIGCLTAACDAADMTLTYDESQGDGDFYIKPTISFSGSNKAIKNGVLCFVWDSSVAVNSNSVTAITSQLLSGTDFGIPDDLLDTWKYQRCVALSPDVVKGGKSGQYQFAFTVDEANLDANDDWLFAVDDLGAFQGRDLCLGNRATSDTTNRVIDFDAQT